MTMTEVQFDYLCQFLRRESAIVLEPGKEYLVESRLAPVARREGLPSVGALVQRLQVTKATSLRAQIVDAMTTNETSFFRDSHPWQTMRETLLPQLIAARASTRRLVIWCAACSSGQEPYSLAMLLREHFPDVVATWQVEIVATDISDAMLARAKEATFSQLEVNRGLPAAMLMRYFQRKGASWQLTEDIRSMISLRTANLDEPQSWAIVAGVDLVMMRNVLIYFDQSTKSKILGDVHRRIRSDGVLMLGSSETNVGVDHRFRRHQSGKTIYFTPS
ncbi:MAG: protein-glutamate O-methyltransferase CheR [Acidimicrobiia bacterium]